jgi:hypothetical protein
MGDTISVTSAQAGATQVTQVVRLDRCEAVTEAVRDVDTLLRYLAQRADRSLADYFAGGPGGKPARAGPVPPREDYSAFLKELFRIESALPLECGPGEAAALTDDDLAFLYRSRDFLSIVASPATAETIRITQAYVEMRMERQGWRQLLRSPGRPAQKTPTRREAADHQVQSFAGGLARRVASIEFQTLLFAIVVVLVSTYALSGRLILAQQAQADAAADEQIQALERQPPDLQAAIVGTLYDDRQATGQRMPCDLRPAPSPPAAGGGAPAVPAPALALAPPVAAAAAAVDGATPSLLGMVNLCERAQFSRTRRFTALLHLRSWASVVTDLPLLPVLFGVKRPMLESFVDRLNTQGCQFFVPYLGHMIDFDKQRGDDQTQRCGNIVVTFVTGSELVARSILDSLTLYVLPVLYAFLGSLAASHRMVRRKIDSFTLGYTDRGVLQQNRVLGVLTGSVIGLVASYFGKPDDSTSLGLSAVSLLAGYNVSAVFAFLDSISARVFGIPKSS